MTKLSLHIIFGNVYGKNYKLHGTFCKILEFLIKFVVAWKNFVKVSCSCQIFMHIKFYIHHVKTCKKCQETYKNM